ncbi:MAG: hypothetical protein ACXWUG_14655 [Polyangiales bacterium]
MKRLLALALVCFPTVASAATYVDTPALGRTSNGVSLYGGTTGGGADLLFGYAWINGWSLHGVAGGARWSSRGALAQTLHDDDVATLLEGYAGVSGRYSFFDREVSPFVGAMVLADYTRVRAAGGSAYGGDASGAVVGGQLGLRWHDSPWDLWAAVDVRHARLSSPYEDEGRIVTTRISVLLGVALESGLR